MIRYKVMTYGGIRGLEFPDLLIKYSSGYTIPLEVHQGEYLPLEILDPLDIKKSLIAGSLGRFISQGKVSVEGDTLPYFDLAKIRAAKKIPAKQTEPTKEDQKEVATETSSASPALKVEPPKIIEPQITNLSDVKELKDFDRLSFYLKKRFLRDSKDMALLLHIYQTTDSNSFKLQIKQRLNDFK